MCSKNKWIVPENKDSLIELKEFPGYFLDEKRMEIWSFLPRWNWNGKAWKKLTVSPNGAFTVRQDGLSRALRIGKLLASIRLGVSYDAIPHQFSFGADGVTPKLRVISTLPTGKAIDRDALNAKLREMRKERNHVVRVERTKRAIEGLNLLLKAFEGDSGPLIQFVASSFDRYSRMACTRAYHTKEDIQDAYDNAFYLLTKQLEKTDTRFYDIDNWMISKMRYYLARLPKKVTWQEYMSKETCKTLAAL